MINFIKKRINWILLIGFFLIIILVSLFSGNDKINPVNEYLFDFGYNDISQLVFIKPIVNKNSNIIDGKLEFNKVNGEWKTQNGNITDFNERITKKIVDIKYAKNIIKYDEPDLMRWRIIPPNYNIILYIGNHVVNIDVGTDIEKTGYYYIKVDDNVFLIEEHYINSIISNLNDLWKTQYRY